MVKRVRRFGIERDEKILFGTCQQPIDQSLVDWWPTTNQTVMTWLDAFDVELLPRLDMIEMPKLSRQNELPLGWISAFAWLIVRRMAR